MGRQVSVHRQSAATRASGVRELAEQDYGDLLALLSADAAKGVCLRDLLETHGVCAEALRGRFYGYFEGAELKGAALLGRAAMFCCGPGVVAHFARAAAESGTECRLVFGEARLVEEFCRRLPGEGYETELVREFDWLVCRAARRRVEQWQMEQARPGHFSAVAEAHAEMVREATGRDPREADADGFYGRVRDRLERGRTWVKVESGQVVFKAEVQSVTPEAIYLEGIWTHPAWRGRGIAKACVTELTHQRLLGRQLVCLVAEPHERAALHIYGEVGYEKEGDYQARYLRRAG